MRNILFVIFFVFQACPFPQLTQGEKYPNTAIFIRYHPSEKPLEIKSMTLLEEDNYKNILNQWEIETLKKLTNNKGILELSTTSFAHEDKDARRVIFVMQIMTEVPFSINKLTKGNMICYQVDKEKWIIYTKQVEFYEKKFTLKKLKGYENQIYCEEEIEGAVTGCTVFDFKQ